MPLEVCPVTLDYETHKFFHEDEFKSELGYSRSTNLHIEKCTDTNTPKKMYLHTGWLINDANKGHAIDIFLFVDNLDCQLQLSIIDEYEVTKSSSLSHSCNLCGNYVFPAKFAQQQCHVSSIVNGSGEIAVVCHCMQWVNEYTTHGDKCFQGELVIQRNTLWNNFVAPTEYDIYPFDVCANIRRNQPLRCLQTGYVDRYTTIHFLFSRSNRKTSVDVHFVVNKECRLHITLKQNGTALEFNDSMSWGYDERFPTEYSDLRCNVESMSDETDTRNRICFKFGESRFEDYCFRGVIVLQKGIIDTRNKITPESAVPVIYELCASPSPTAPPKWLDENAVNESPDMKRFEYFFTRSLECKTYEEKFPRSTKSFTPYKEQCVQVSETIVRSLSWQNTNGEGHIENLEVQIVRNMSCELNLHGVWRREHFHITFGETNVRVQDQGSRERICVGLEYMICFTLLQQQSTNMGCIGGSLRWTVLEKKNADFQVLLTEGYTHLKICPLVCNINND